MQIVIHRVNTVAGLLELPSEFGVELDVRSAGGELILHHDPHQGGERFADYLEYYRHGLMVKGQLNLPNTADPFKPA